MEGLFSICGDIADLSQWQVTHLFSEMISAPTKP